MSLDALFEPMTIGSLEIPNRVIMAPLTHARADDRHLIKDEPAEPEHVVEPVEAAEPVEPIPTPARRTSRSSPRTYRDLDAIPDDFD